MKNLSYFDFGVSISCILPGFIMLWGLGYLSPTVQLWLHTAGTNYNSPPTVGGFFYVVVASVTLGMTASAVRWVIIDRIHENTGIARPDWDDSKLQQNMDAFALVVEHHYHYYLFYSNSLISLAVVYAARRYSAWGTAMFPDYTELTFLIVGTIFWLTSRDNLRKYYKRASQIFRDTSSQEQPAMSNGSNKHNSRPPKSSATHDPSRPDLNKSKEKDAEAERKKKKATPEG